MSTLPGAGLNSNVAIRRPFDLGALKWCADMDPYINGPFYWCNGDKRSTATVKDVDHLCRYTFRGVSSPRDAARPV